MPHPVIELYGAYVTTALTPLEVRKESIYGARTGQKRLMRARALDSQAPLSVGTHEHLAFLTVVDYFTPLTFWQQNSLSCGRIPCHKIDSAELPYHRVVHVIEAWPIRISHCFGYVDWFKDGPLTPSSQS